MEMKIFAQCTELNLAEGLSPGGNGAIDKMMLMKVWIHLDSNMAIICLLSPIIIGCGVKVHACINSKQNRSKLNQEVPLYCSCKLKFKH